MSFDTCLGPVLLGAVLIATPALAQEAPATVTPAPEAEAAEAAAPQVAPAPILSSDIAVSTDAAELSLELGSDRTLVLVLDEAGAVRVNGERIGSYERRGNLDRAWRDLLQRAMDTPPGAVADLLVDWQPAEDAGALARRLDRELEAAIQTAPVTAAAPGETEYAADSIRRLNERIQELEQLVDDPEAVDALNRLERLDNLQNLEELEELDELGPALRELRRELERELRHELRNEIQVEMSSDWTDHWSSPWRHFTRGLSGVFSTLMTYAILVGLGFLAVFFGRKYLENIADTARTQTLRSGLVGLAGSFLVLPAYILGLLALAISIVGIPLILVFAPLFPVAVVLAAIGGYLAVAHGAGESLAERRFTGNDWFARANSYYYVMTGVGLLLVLFLAAHIISMAGPWLGFVEGLLKFMAVMLTWIAFTIGFGAFLISRAGTRNGDGDAGSVLDEEPNHA